MSTKLLLADLIQLQSELVEERRSVNWALKRKMLVTILKLWLLQLKYESDKSKYRLHIEFMETTEPFSEKDRNNIKKSSAVNKQIGKHLSALRKLK